MHILFTFFYVKTALYLFLSLESLSRGNKGIKAINGPEMEKIQCSAPILNEYFRPHQEVIVHRWQSDLPRSPCDSIMFTFCVWIDQNLIWYQILFGTVDFSEISKFETEALRIANLTGLKRSDNRFANKTLN